jgi:transcriptional regulator with XRE-family HTH domain
MEQRRATDEAPYSYELGGGFLLSGISVYRCPICGVEIPTIPKIAQLHRKMAEILVAKPTPLVGQEIRFLRKSAGFPAKEFAALLGISPSYLSRVENGKEGHENLGSAADKLARLLGHEGASAREGLMRLAAKAIALEASGVQAQALSRVFRLIRGKGWKAAA